MMMVKVGRARLNFVGAQKILDTVKNKEIKWIFKIILNDRINRETIKNIYSLLKKNKKKKKKGKKKKKKND